MIKTRDISVIRGQTLPILFIVRDHLKQRQDLTDAVAYLWVRADAKVDASIKLASATTDDHRIGIVFADQTADHKGEFTATLIPEDTQGLVALGADDPYIYDAWVVLVDGSRWPVVATSKMPLHPETTTIAP